MVIAICAGYVLTVVAILYANNFIHTPSNGHYYICEELNND